MSDRQTRYMIGQAEIDAALDNCESDSLEWMAERGIDLAAMLAILNSAARMGVKHYDRDHDLEGAFADIAGQAFRLGFEVASARATAPRSSPVSARPLAPEASNE